MTAATHDSVGPWTSPATSSLQDEPKGISSSFDNTSDSPLRLQTIDDPVGIGLQELAVKGSVQPHPTERSSDSILTIHFLTGAPWVWNAPQEINRIVGAHKVLGARVSVPNTLTLTCDSKESGDTIATLIQQGHCKHLWSSEAHIFVQTGESKDYILALSMRGDWVTVARPGFRWFSDPWETLLPTLQQNLSSFVGDVHLKALSPLGLASNPPWYVLCEGDPERLEAFLGPLNGRYETRLGFAVRPKRNITDKYTATIKVLCLSNS